MKLEPRAKIERLKASTVLHSEEELDESNVQRLLLQRKAQIEAYARATLVSTNPELGINSSNLKTVADLILLDQTIGGQLLAPDIKRELLVTFGGYNPALDPGALRDLIDGAEPGALIYAAWVQLVPEEADRVKLTDADLQTAIKQAEQSARSFVVTPQRLLVCLAQMRPDQYAQLASLISLEEFDEQVWQERAQFTKDLLLAHIFLETLAAVYILHPEARERFVLSTVEKEKLVHFASFVPIDPGASFLRNAAIVLAEEAVLQPNGQLQIRLRRKPMQRTEPLPMRSQV